MQLVIHSSNFVPVALASMHGTTDFSLPKHCLLPYTLLLYFPENVPITPVFLCASIIHFHRDIGLQKSIIFHIILCLLAAINMKDLSFDLFSVYFCLIHTPLHYYRHQNSLVYPIIFTFVCGFILTIVDVPGDILLTEWMQRLVIAHIICDEITMVGGNFNKKKLDNIVNDKCIY